MVINAENHITAATAVTAVRTTGCDIFFSVERYCTIAASASVDANAGFINK
jgi:hypothetical protein